MKIISTLVLSMIVFASSAQTNIIRAKSHSSKIHGPAIESDNYGIPSPMIRIDSVILLTDNCLIEVSVVDDMARYRDTICDHPYLQGRGVELNEIKKHYSKNTKFEGFKQSPKLETIDQSSRFNGTSILTAICISIALFFGAVPAIKK